MYVTLFGSIFCIIHVSCRNSWVMCTSTLRVSLFMRDVMKWNLLYVNGKNELLTVSKRRISPASELWRRSSAGSLPCDEHTRTVREAEKDKHSVSSNLQAGRERPSSRTQQNYILQLTAGGVVQQSGWNASDTFRIIILELKILSYFKLISYLQQIHSQRYHLRRSYF